MCTSRLLLSLPSQSPKASVWKKQKGRRGQARSPAPAGTVGEVSPRFEDYCPLRSLGSSEVAAQRMEEAWGGSSGWGMTARSPVQPVLTGLVGLEVQV